MRLLLGVFCALALVDAITAAVEKAAKCDKEACQLPNCRCSSRDIPGGYTAEEIPQFVLLTFDDAVTVSNIDFYRKATLNYERGNPDGCPSAMTFFLSHEYTDYTLVHELHANGHEIALHSLTHSENDIFSNEKVFEREFADQRDMVAKFANIKKSDIQGLRMPYLQLGSDVQFDFMAKNNFTYDFSWVTQNQISPGLWPYTLDYASLQECLTQENCPKGSHPGVWELPMLSWRDLEDRPCAMFDGCIKL
jgi:Polysaccharide deacetylase